MCFSDYLKVVNAVKNSSTLPFNMSATKNQIKSLLFISILPRISNITATRPSLRAGQSQTPHSSQIWNNPRENGGGEESSDVGSSRFLHAESCFSAHSMQSTWHATFLPRSKHWKELSTCEDIIVKTQYLQKQREGFNKKYLIITIVYLSI